ncbi:unnamed protein product [Eruca vesicaria subsp. sativa]|uniref:GRF-type domain-containing protein n=1 Tax=Eruca vesicaria subsp. sativa TaxID=29727 RepID=A0ABC8KDC1_ERUVS|nr:unnamed protein product [Eruca vesicaria subsp. sativa]
MPHPYQEMKDMKRLKQHYDRLGFTVDAQYVIPTCCPCGDEIKHDVVLNAKYPSYFDTLPGRRYFTCKSYERKRDFLRGIPSHWWCGNPISVFVSKTTRNPFKTFYRCEVARMREGCAHLFTWLDEALVEEVSMVEARQTTVEEDLEAMVTAEFSGTSGTREVRKNIVCVAAISWLCCKFW